MLLYYNNMEEKYNKYKNKYLKLKNINNSKNKYLKLKGGNDYINELFNIYPKIEYINSSNTHKYNTTYGEIHKDSIDYIFNLNKNHDTFIDLGSGNGFSCFYAAFFENIKKCIGIELVKERHEKAISIKNNLNNFEEHINKVELINDDIFNISLEEFNNNNVIIWVSNLLFSNELNNKLFEKLYNEINDNTIIFTSSKPNEHKLELIETFNLKMSWIDNSNVYMFKKNN